MASSQECYSCCCSFEDRQYGPDLVVGDGQEAQAAILRQSDMSLSGCALQTADLVGRGAAPEYSQHDL
jgi:hypothetical protein